MNPNTEHNLYNLIVNCSRIMNKASGQLFQCQLRLPCPPPLSCSTPLLFKEQFCGLSPSLWTGPNKMFKRSSSVSRKPEGCRVCPTRRIRPCFRCLHEVRGYPRVGGLICFSSSTPSKDVVFVSLTLWWLLRVSFALSTDDLVFI